MGRKRGRRKAPFKLKLPRETVLSLIALFLWFFAGLIIVSFTQLSPFLSRLYSVLEINFGVLIFFIPFLFINAGLMVSQINWKVAKPNVFLGSLVLFAGLLGLLRGGLAGSQIFTSLALLIHPFGASFFLFTLVIAGVLVVSETALAELFASLGKFTSLFSRSSSTSAPVKVNHPGQLPLEEKDLKIKGVPLNDSPAPTPPVKPTDEKTTDSPPITTASTGTPIIWKEPPVTLLSNTAGGKADRGDLKKNAATIEDVLSSFNIKARVVEVNCGPAVTQYALEISLGTKLSKITSLQNDLALALAAPTGQIRIEAPIPGRSLVGIEIPNRSAEFVSLKQMLVSDVMKKHKSKLAVSLGLNVSGEPVVADIASMPHVLIAGATGSGKSVCLNAFLASILFRASPDEVKFILVDPKRVELTGYNNIPHLLTPVIVEPEKVLSALKWAVTEMQGRYKVFSEVGVRNIEAYNDMSGFQSLPYILIVIDELADIMLFSPGEVEESITKIAQMARATGIHLVLATQRPSVDVITGLIKANIPCRLAFNVTSMVDSRVIIDGPGAEKLLGHGDMLYIPPTQSKPTRIQGTFVSDKEISSLISYLKDSGITPQYAEEVTAFTSKSTSSGSGRAMEGVDDLFEDAVRTVVKFNRASASLLQRQLSIGYARAARIIDQLVEAGVINAPDGSSKPRDVLIKSADDFFARQ